MKRYFFMTVLCFLTLVTPRIVAGQTADKTFDVVTYSFAEIPRIPEGVRETPTDLEIKKLSESLPLQLETEIQSLIPRKKISFLDVEDFPKLQEVLVYTKATFKFEDVKTVIKAISKKVAEADAVLFMKIEKVGYVSIKITAKIVDVSSRKLTQKQVEVNLTIHGLLKEKMKDLARDLVKDIVSQKSILHKPVIWATIATVASAIWWLAENEQVITNDEIYDEATTIVDATNAGIDADKSVTRREIAAISTGVSAGAFLVFLIFD